jgi:hypothetical protein
MGAKSGWGKSRETQVWAEENMLGDTFDRVVILDYKDEFRGLVKEGFASYWGAGSREAAWSAAEWRQVIAQNPNLVVAKHNQMDAETWREQVCGPVVAACRQMGDTLIIIDEAHFVVPQSGTIPDPISGLGTTGRGEGVSSILVTQRMQMVDEDFVSQLTAWMLGGFGSDNDRDKLGGIVDGYPVEVHNPTATTVANLPEELRVEAEVLPVRKFQNEDGQTIGSEWIYSNESGELNRYDTRYSTMQSTHYGQSGNAIERPEYQQ